MFAQTKSPVRMGENAEALVTVTPVLVLKDSREKIAKVVSKSLTKKCVNSESVRIKCLQYCHTFLAKISTG